VDPRRAVPEQGLKRVAPEQGTLDRPVKKARVRSKIKSPTSNLCRCVVPTCLPMLSSVLIVDVQTPLCSAWRP
jgi:hypothetical protein